MPLYEYECGACEHRFERLARVREADRGQQCPECGSKSVRRLMSVFSTGAGKNGGSEGPTCSTGLCNLPE